MMDNYQWYIVQVYSGVEESVLNNIKQTIKARNLDKFFEEFFFPIANSPKSLKEMKPKSLYPGYVFIKMILNHDTWNVVSNTNKVVGFSGNDRMNPRPISEAEFTRMIESIQERANQVVVATMFKVGDNVKITKGSFQGVVGKINSVDEPKNKLNVLVKIFDRETAIDILIDEVELFKKDAA